MSEGDDGYPRPLARNSACHQCRKRKLKCDAFRPVCTNCQKPRMRGLAQKQGEPEPCTWDDPKAQVGPSASKSRKKKEDSLEGRPSGSGEGSKRARLSELEERIAAFERVLQDRKTEEDGDQPNGVTDVPDESPPIHGGAYVHMSHLAPRNPDPAFKHPLAPRNEPYPGDSPKLRIARESTHWTDVNTRVGAINPGTIGAGEASRGGVPPPTGRSVYQTGTNAYEGMINGINGLETQPLTSGDQSSDPLWSFPDDSQTRVGGSTGTKSGGSGGESTGWTPVAEFLNTASSAEASPGDKGDDAMKGVMWPDWPRDLPSLDVVEHVANLFFDRVSTWPKMIHRSSFMHCLQMPPSHQNFPCVPLIHAILAVTAPHLPTSLISSRAYFPIGASAHASTHPMADFNSRFDGLSANHRGLASSLHVGTSSLTSLATTPLGRFQVWHRRKAQEGLAVYLDRGEKYLQAVQVHILVAAVDHYNAWWTDLYLESGGCLRICLPLRLNDSPHTVPGAMQRFVHVLVPNAATPLEQAERDRTFWMAYLTERTTTLCCGWPEILADDDITVELPCLQDTYDAGHGELGGVQSFLSPDLHSGHPLIHQDGLSFYIKAVKLWTDVNRFLRKYIRVPHYVQAYSQLPQVRTYLSQINAFRMSFPPHFRRPTLDRGAAGNVSIDPDVVASLFATNGAMLAICEPMICRSMWKGEVARMGLNAIRSALSLVYDITATSYDVSLLPGSCCYVWCVAARGLAQFIGCAEADGDYESAEVFKSEFGVFRMAMRQYGERYPVGQRHLQLVDDLYDAMVSGQKTVLMQLLDKGNDTKLSSVEDVHDDNSTRSNVRIQDLPNLRRPPSPMSKFRDDVIDHYVSATVTGSASAPGSSGGSKTTRSEAVTPASSSGTPGSGVPSEGALKAMGWYPEALNDPEMSWALRLQSGGVTAIAGQPQKRPPPPIAAVEEGGAGLTPFLDLLDSMNNPGTAPGVGSAPGMASGSGLFNAMSGLGGAPSGVWQAAEGSYVSAAAGGTNMAGAGRAGAGGQGGAEAGGGAGGGGDTMFDMGVSWEEWGVGNWSFEVKGSGERLP